MIREDEIFKIGKLLKPHGVKGEISFAFDNNVLDNANCKYLICQIDGIFVPFFIKEYRFKGANTALVIFEDLDSEEKVRRLSNLDVYFPRSSFNDNESDIDYSWNYFMGFSVIDDDSDITIGTITDIDESTINILLILQNEAGEEILIPASEDFILEVDDETQSLRMKLPEGLLE